MQKTSWPLLGNIANPKSNMIKLEVLAFMAFVLALSLPACKKNTAVSCEDTIVFNKNETIELCFGQSAVWNQDKGVKIRFEQVVLDNRCPSDVQCFTGGGAQAQFSLFQQSAGKLDTLSTGDWNQGFLADSATLGALRIKLLEVSPYPKSNQTIAPSDYKVKLEIKPKN